MNTSLIIIAAVAYAGLWVSSGSPVKAAGTLTLAGAILGLTWAVGVLAAVA